LRMPGNRDAVDSGHLQICYDHIRGRGIHERNRFRP
jgi:hypothetical protein